MPLLDRSPALTENTPYRPDHVSVDLDSFKQNPLEYYKKLLQKNFDYEAYSPTENFLGIVIEKKRIDQNEYAALYENEEVNNNFIGEFNFASLAKQGARISLYTVAVPRIEGYMPNDITKNELIALYKGVANTGYYIGSGEIDEFTAVTVEKPIYCLNRRQPFRIIEVHNYKIQFRAKESILDILKACKQADFNLVVPDIKLSSSITPPKESIPSGIDYSILTSKYFSSQDLAEKFSPYLYPNNTPKPPIILSRQAKTPSNPTPSTEQVDPNCESPIQNPVTPEQKKEDIKVDGAFLKNGLRTNETLIDKDGNKFFRHPESDPTPFGINQSLPGRIFFEASDDPNSLNPFINFEEDLRNISMVVVKEVPYISLSDYTSSVISNKKDAAHFVINYEGIIYQTTDTKNLVRSYNPTIDEISIYIAVLNIPYSNSKKTQEYIQRGFDKSSATARLTSDLDFKKQMFADKLKLKAYMNKFDIKREELFTFDIGMLKDGRLLYPNYRFDNTIDQKYALTILIKKICESYNIDLKRPKINGLDPNVMAGDYNGVVAPYYFSNSDTSFLGINSKEFGFIKAE